MIVARSAGFTCAALSRTADGCAWSWARPLARTSSSVSTPAGKLAPSSMPMIWRRAGAWPITFAAWAGVETRASLASLSFNM